MKSKNANIRSLLFVLIDLISAFLLMNEAAAEIKPFVLAPLSLILVLKPVSIIPMLFVSSWSISLAAFPGLAAYFYYLALFFVSIVLSLFFKKGKNIISFVPKAHQARFAVWFALWVFITAFSSVSGEWYDALKLAFYILPLFIVARLYLPDLETCRTSIDIIAVFFSVYLLYVIVYAPVDYISDNKEVLTTYSSFRSDMNPNTGAQIVLVLFTILYCEAFRTKKYWLFLFAGLNGGTIMVLGSRTAFFTMIVIALVYLMVVLKTTILKKTVLFAVFVGLFFALYSFGSRFERFERLNISSFQEDQGSGRFYTWEVLLKEVIPYHWVKGVGFGKANFENLPIFAGDGDNLYIDLLTATGIVGLLLFFAFYATTLINLLHFRKKKRDWDFLIAIFLAYLVEGMGETVFDTTLFWFWSFLAMLAINQLKSSKKDYSIKTESEEETEMTPVSIFPDGVFPQFEEK